MKISRDFLMTERMWQVAILALSGAVILLTAWCTVQGITTVFMHLYYIPIVLLAYHYRKKGVILSILLSLFYLTSTILSDAHNLVEIESAVFRALIFIAIAVLVAYLSENLVMAGDRLRISGDIQEGIIQNANVWLMVLEKDGRIREWNRAAEEISGYLKSEVVGKNTIWKLLYPEPEYRKEITGKISEIIAKNNFLENLRTTITCRDGSKKTILWNTKVLPHENSQSPRFIAVGVDITERTRAEEALWESDAKNRLLLNSAAEAIYGLDMNGNCTFCNEACLRVLGYHHQDELLGKNMHRQIHAKRADGSHFPVEECRVFQAFRKGEGTHVDDEVLWRADGTSFPAEYWSYPQRYKGEVIGAVVTFLDITDRKRTEDALRRSEKKYHTLFENMVEAFVYGHMIYDDQGRPSDWVYLSVNRAFEEITGQRDVEGKRALEVMPDFRAQVPELFERYGRIAKTGIPESFEQYIKPLGLWHQISVYSPEKGYFVAVFVDITGRKAAQDRIQELLRIQERQLKIINTSPAVAFLWKAEENWPVEMVSENISQFGYTSEDFLSGRILFSSVIHPDDLQRIGGEVEYNSTHHIDDYTQEYRLIGKDKKEYWVSDYTHIRRDASGTITHYEGIILDISDRKRAEELLKETNDYLQSLFDYANAPIMVWDPGFRITRFNHAFEHLTGRTEKEVIGQHISILFPESSRESSLEQIGITLAGEHWETVEIPILHVSGDVRTILWNSATLFGEDGKTVITTIAQGQDITERKEAEEALRESRQLFSDIISFLPDPTFVIDTAGNVLAWNQAYEKISGIPAADMIGKGNYEYSIWQYGKRRPVLIDLVLHPDQDFGRMGYTGIRDEGLSVMAQTELLRPDGRKLIFALVASPLYDAKGAIIGAIESMRDITRLKKTEDELAQLNADLEKIVRDRTQALHEEIVQRKNAEQEVQDVLTYTRSVIEANPDLMVVLDLTGTILDVNAAAELLTGIPRDQLIGTSYSRYLIDNTTPEDILDQLREKRMIEYTIQLRRTDGHLTPLTVNSTLFRGKDATDARIIVAAHDITRQKQDEAAIRASLDEKVLLLREIHHRVNNNLQIIISLTKLQIRTLEDPWMKQVLAETQNRVRAMSLVHEKLYLSENLSSIDLYDYTRFLATQLFASYGVDHRRVTLLTEIGKIALDIDTAIPLGLILNELISNALRHAFPDNRSGTLSISSHLRDNLITLVIKDDGPGLKPGFDWKETDSLGLRLTNSLVDQLGGTIERGPGTGTMFIITLPSKSTGGSRT